jgi:transposase
LAYFALQPVSFRRGIDQILKCGVSSAADKPLPNMERRSNSQQSEVVLMTRRSQDIKDRVPILHHLHSFSVKQICMFLGVQKSFVYNTLRYHRDHGVTHNPSARSSHRKRTLTSVDLEFIRSLLAQRHTLYLDEIQLELRQRRNVCVSLSTLMRTLRRLHFSHKSVSIKALERNELRRALYMNQIGAEVPNPYQLMFIDESAKNDRIYARQYGWSRVGTRCVQRACFVHG